VQRAARQNRAVFPRIGALLLRGALHRALPDLAVVRMDSLTASVRHADADMDEMIVTHLMA